jgi:Zn-dependent protease
MLNKKEIFLIALIIIIISLSVNLSLDITENWKKIWGTLLAVSLVILLNIFAKKITAYKLDSEIEMKILEMKKIGFTGMRYIKHLKKPFPIGAFLPIISKIIFFPFKSFVWMACLVFDIKPRIYRGARRYGLYTFSEMTEYHLGLIAASGIVINLISAIAGYFLGFPLFARLNIYCAFFNMLPISELDGNKIFFGSLVLWSFLASLVLIGMLFAIFMV